MTDQELIRKISIEVMGWSEKEDSWSRYFYGEPSSGRSWFYFDGEKRKFRVCAFNPLTNPAHWMMVVERMTELKLYIHLTRGLSQYAVTFRIFEGDIFRPTKPAAYNQSLGHAICEAALKAVEAT